MFQSENLFEYLLVANPSSALAAIIMQEKRWFIKEFTQSIATGTLPHLTIASFLGIEETEASINRLLENIFSSMISFSVTLEQYSGLPHHTIYLNVKNPLPFQQLAKQLNPVADLFKSSSCPPWRIINKPNLIIAHDLPEDVYNKAMTLYGKKKFSESFMLNELLLLRRKHQFDKCKTVQVFRLRPTGRNVLRDVA